MTMHLAVCTRRWAVALVTAAIATVLTGCSVAAGSAGSELPAIAPITAVGVPVVLRFGDRVATATLTDTPESRQLAAMLPLTVHLKDVWGQAKSGPLPRTLTALATPPIHDPVPGNIYLWPQTDVIAIYYDDLGQAVPDPGLVRLGVVDTGLDSLAHAGRRLTVRIELASGTPPLMTPKTRHCRTR